TTSFNSVQDILGSLMLIQKIAGRLSGIPLMLKLFPKTVQVPTGQATVYTASLIDQGSPFALAETAKKCLMLEYDETLAPDQTIETEEEAEIAEEFYPPETDDKSEALNVAETIKKARNEGRLLKVEAKNIKQKFEEPTAAELAKRTKQNEDAKKEKQEKAKAVAAAKKEKVMAAAAAKETSEAEQQTEDTSEDMPKEEPSIEEGEALDGPPEDFGWV
ncbi:hypothetical protein KA005_33415, partial [bacterium]|nr:hypothetical protein [bacterium]